MMEGTEAVATAVAGASTAEASLKQVALVFLKLGTVAFGGPAAHLAMMEDEFVTRRQWLTREQFLDRMGVLKPVVIAVVIQAFWKLARTAVKTKWLAVVGILAAVLYAIGVHGTLILAIAAVLAAAQVLYRSLRSPSRLPALLLAQMTPARAFAVLAATAAPFGLWRLFLVFAKIGAVLFGSGYVLLAFLQADLVDRLHWLTERQLLDAVAVGQITPGPLFTTATFIGYIVGGIPGAVVATVGIFAPGFVYVALSGLLIPRIRSSRVASSMLDGVVVGSLALMGVVAWQLGRAAIIDVPTVVIAALSTAVLLRFRVNSAWLIAAAGAFGWLYRG